MLFDSHCHLDMSPLGGVLQKTLARAAAADVSQILIPGVDPKGWARALGLTAQGLTAQGLTAQDSPIVLHFAAGLHPWVLDTLTPAALEHALEALPQMLIDLQAVAVGELGWHRDGKRPTGSLALARQDALASRQIRLAQERALPLILHIVGLHGHALTELQKFGHFAHGGVVHSYTGSAELLPAYLKLGLSIGIGPAITRPNAKRVRAAAREIPDSRLLIETDAPDQRIAGSEQAGHAALHGHPAQLPAIARALADIRGQELTTLINLTRANAERLFGAGALAHETV